MCLRTEYFKLTADACSPTLALARFRQTLDACWHTLTRCAYRQHSGFALALVRFHMDWITRRSLHTIKLMIQLGAGSMTRVIATKCCCHNNNNRHHVERVMPGGISYDYAMYSRHTRATSLMIAHKMSIPLSYESLQCLLLLRYVYYTSFLVC